MRHKQLISPLLLMLSAVALTCVLAAKANATIYNVGPGQAFPTIGSVPWETLAAGDTVNIFYSPTPYKEKFVLSRVGTAAAPITVHGVLGPNGERPILDGNGATTRSQLVYYSQERGVIKIGGSTVPFADGVSVNPQYLVIENLEIRGARQPFTFTAADGTTKSYTSPASAIYLEFGDHITVRNCVIHDCGNGFFSFSNNTTTSSNVLVEANYIYDNGNSGSQTEHNNYTESRGITFQYNRFGQIRAGCGGNGLKDRSSGLVIRYNWFEGPVNRPFDLVDAQDSTILKNDPNYHKSYVYGNVVIENPLSGGNNDIVHYGGDTAGGKGYKLGPLYFYNNTVVSNRTDNTRLFRLDTNSQSCDARNNIVYVTAAGSTLKVLDSFGALTLTQNWFKTGWSPFNVAHPKGSITNNGTVTGTTPGFVSEAGQDYHLVSGSACINAGTTLNPGVLPDNDVIREYLKHQLSVARAVNGALDIGAYEF
ncbi:MAG TPA: right-handed parallel beta-helix repeat-containing protein [Pyrinomonadaceae bacterium]|nr:right-handed parallel beta-helix repeat-containing protein [Pyrinomonadaceae bacterium]